MSFTSTVVSSQNPPSAFIVIEAASQTTTTTTTQIQPQPDSIQPQALLFGYGEEKKTQN